MKTTLPFILAAVVVPTTQYSLRQTVWLPLNWSPAMGHAASPATQAITKNTTLYTITASVTDMDTFKSNLELTQTTNLAGNEGDVSIVSNINGANILASNPSFDPATGKREVTYTLKNDM